MKELHKLGYTKYDQFLQSTDWQITVGSLKKDNCYYCKSSTGLTLHHITYVNLGRETDEDVLTLCWKCHRKEHARLLAEERLKEKTKQKGKVYNPANVKPPQPKDKKQPRQRRNGITMKCHRCSCYKRYCINSICPDCTPFLQIR